MPDPSVPAAARRLRHLGAPRLVVRTRRSTRRTSLAITQAICDYRQATGIDGPLFLGMDTHALSEPACASALEVLAAQRRRGDDRRRRRLHADAGRSRTPS